MNRSTLTQSLNPILDNPQLKILENKNQKYSTYYQYNSAFNLIILFCHTIILMGYIALNDPSEKALYYMLASCIILCIYVVLNSYIANFFYNKQNLKLKIFARTKIENILKSLNVNNYISNEIYYCNYSTHHSEIHIPLILKEDLFSKRILSPWEKDGTIKIIDIDFINKQCLVQSQLDLKEYTLSHADINKNYKLIKQ